MHLQLASDAPLMLRAAAATALIVHVGGASVGMASGLTAVFTRKGGRVHRAAGHVFFVAMLAMSGVAAIVAPMFPDRLSGLMGAFAFYLTATGWAAVRRPGGQVGRFELAAGCWAVAVALVAVWLGRMGSLAPKGLLDDQPYQLGYVLAAVAGLSAVADFRMVRRGGLAGPPRIARHLWRMCVALFIALGSAAAQIKVVELLPGLIRHSSLALMTPALTVLALMAFWLIRIRVPRRRRRKLEPALA